jgi:hypothetical protein
VLVSSLGEVFGGPADPEPIPAAPDRPLIQG